jgi:hypothetical protein
MDTLFQESHAVSRLGRMAGTFATLLGGVSLPVALLLFGISRMRPGSLTAFPGLEALLAIPLLGLLLAGLGAAACRAMRCSIPTICWVALSMNLAAWIILRAS